MNLITARCVCGSLMAQTKCVENGQIQAEVESTIALGVEQHHHVGATRERPGPHADHLLMGGWGVRRHVDAAVLHDAICGLAERVLVDCNQLPVQKDVGDVGRA